MDSFHGTSVVSLITQLGTLSSAFVRAIQGMDDECVDEAAASFTSALLTCEDLLPNVLWELDFVSLAQASAVCHVLRRAVDNILQFALMPAEQMSTGRPAYDKTPARFLFVAVMPNGDIIISDSPDDENKKSLLYWNGTYWRREAHPNPTGLAATAHETLIVAMASNYEEVVYEQDRGGNCHWRALTLPVTRGSGPRLSYALGVAWSPATNRVFVVSSDTHVVIGFDVMKPTARDRLVFLGRYDGEQGSGDGELRDPFDVEVHNGLAFVTDSANNRVSVFDEAGGKWLAHLVARDPPFDDPSGIVCMPTGQIVVNETSGRVRIFRGLSDAHVRGQAGRGDIVLLTMQSFYFDGQLAGLCVDVARNRILIANSSVEDHLEVLRPACVGAVGALYTSLAGVGQCEGDDVQRPRKQRDGRHLLPVRCILSSTPLLPKASDEPSKERFKTLSDLTRVRIITDATDVAKDSGTAAITTLDFSHVPPKPDLSSRLATRMGTADRAVAPVRFPDVYPPSMPDTRLFLDVLARDAPALAKRRPTLCIEIACGAAPLAALLRRLLGPTAAILATDVSASAMRAASETVQRNSVPLHLMRADVLDGVRPGTIDLLVCHPPYVPTSRSVYMEAIAKASASADGIERAPWAWAGGPHGRAVVDKLLGSLDTVLSPLGVAYVLFYDEKMFMHAFKDAGLASMGWQCARATDPYKADGEVFIVMRIERPGASACCADV